MFESVEENQFPSHNQEMQRDPSIAEALDHFSQAVSMGVSVLCDRLGYSSTRAADSILNTFTESKYTLDDDKVSEEYSTIGYYGLRQGRVFCQPLRKGHVIDPKFRIFSPEKAHRMVFILLTVP
jgi:hypothetical protein